MTRKLIQKKIAKIQKEDKLINKIIELTDNPYMSKTDELIDDFVVEYDKGEWCRGHFKSMIAVLVFETKKKIFDDIEENLDYHKMVFIGKKFIELKKKHINTNNKNEVIKNEKISNNKENI